MFVSPWLQVAAGGLLTLIIVIFAANNIQREKDLLTESLFRKGQALVNFVGAGTRAFMMSGMMGMLSMSGVEQTQHLIEQTSEDPDIRYIAVVDISGQILAHSDSSLIGKNLGRDLTALLGPGPTGRFGLGKYHIVASAGDAKKVFEVVSPFEPFSHRRSGALLRWRLSWLPPGYADQGQGVLAEAGTRASLFNTPLEPRPVTLLILVGLDMTTLETAIREYRYQIIFLSLALLLVGLGGWISLLAAQGYRVSQNALHQVQAFTGLLISRLPVGIIATDPAGRIKTFNQAAAAMTGVTTAATINCRPAEILPPALADFVGYAGIEAKDGDEVAEREINLAAAGKTFTLHLSSVPVCNREGDFMGRVLLMYDLTELKKLEKEVQRHDRLVALGKMAAGVAHEVRNPLSSIKGFATLLGSRFKKGSEEQEAANLLVHEAERLNRSITELLNYARPTPLNRLPVDLEKILSDSLKLVSTDAAALGVAVDLQVDPALATIPAIMVDPDRLNQVLLNLYLNALQAMEKGGRLTVVAGLGEQQNSVAITVRDTGHGIPAEVLDRVMDPYFTTKADGTGLGLAMAYKIIDEHGGALRFTSREGQGTEVLVTLPG